MKEKNAYKSCKAISGKKILITIIIISLFAGVFTACAGNDIYYDRDKSTEGGLNIVTTIFPPWDFARNITGGKGEVSMLLPPGSESHSYEPSPQDIIKIQNSDIFIFTGGESDQWMEEILNSIDDGPDVVIRLMDCVETVEEELSEGMTSHEKHSHEVDYDEHVWTSPENAIIITEEILKAVCSLDEENQQHYTENAQSYISRLEQLSQGFRDIVAEGNRNTVVFGDRFPFRYFADEYGLEYYAAFPGCSSESEPSAATLAFLTELVKKEEIPTVFYIEFSNHKVADMICEATGAEAALFHSCHNVSKSDMEQGKTYIDLMEENQKKLKEALL